jgi:threonine dehydrogenase-like Zn-dependent dehydrogenase
MISNGKFDPSPMIAGIYDLDHALDAFELAANGGPGKVLVRPNIKRWW